MARRIPTTVKAYLAELPADRRAVISGVRKMILKNLPVGYVEAMRWDMISYEIPLSVYPNTYNDQPLSFAGLADEKNHYALYLTCIFSSPRHLAILKDAYAKAGKKPDMGQSCIRFKTLAELPLDAIEKMISGSPPKTLIKIFEASRRK